MTRLLQPAAALLTSAQIAAIILKSRQPCPICSGLDFALTHRGDWICVECDPARGLSSGVAARILLSEAEDGSWLAQDHRIALMKATERRTIEEAGGLIVSHNGDQWAAWMAADGSCCWSNLRYNNPEAVAGRIRRMEVPRVW